MEYYLDIITYVKKMQEIDILKYLLLNKDQVNLFNFLTRPTVSMLYSDSDDIYQSIQKRENKTKITSREIEEIVQSYNTIKNNNDDLNKKLFYLFDYEVDHLITG